MWMWMWTSSVKKAQYFLRTVRTEDSVVFLCGPPAMIHKVAPAGVEMLGL